MANDITSILSYPNGNPHGVSFRQLNGKDVTIDYLHKSFSSVPDSLFLIHDTKLFSCPSGCSVIICRFSANGSKLYGVTAMNNGSVAIPQTSNASEQDIKPEASMKRTSSDVSADSGSCIADDYEYQYHAEHINFQETPFEETMSKYNPHKKQMLNTLGAYVEFHAPQCVLDSNTTAAVSRIQGTSKKVCNSMFQSIPTHLAANDVMVVGNETSFVHSALLPYPIKWKISGTIKFLVNEFDRVQKLELMIVSHGEK